MGLLIRKVGVPGGYGLANEELDELWMQQN